MDESANGQVQFIALQWNHNLCDVNLLLIFFWNAVKFVRNQLIIVSIGCKEVKIRAATTLNDWSGDGRRLDLFCRWKKVSESKKSYPKRHIYKVHQYSMNFWFLVLIIQNLRLISTTWLKDWNGVLLIYLSKKDVHRKNLDLQGLRTTVKSIGNL